MERITIPEVQEVLDDSIAKVFRLFQDGTGASGDITPSQVNRLAKLSHDLAELISEQVNQNIQ